MSHEALIAALHAEGEGKAEAIRLKAEQAAATIEAEAKERLAALEQEQQRLLSSEEKRLAADIIAAANREARGIRAACRRRLAERLEGLAKKCLFNLRQMDYQTAFSRLVGEIPAENWHEIKVHPQDEKLARTFFPDTPIVFDETITGGFELLSEDGGLHIDNTLSKRLERNWPLLLPGIIKQVEKEARKQ
jgi:V/A-type H+-transporting ATPase subunit E